MSLAYPEPPLSDGVVLLRPWDDGDVGVVGQASCDAYVAQIEHLPAPFTRDAGRSWIAAQHSRFADGRGLSFAIVALESREIVGGTGISHRHPPGTAEPGVWILEHRRNEGLAARATRLLCDWALTADVGIARVQATVEPWNVASQRVLERLGFQREGLLRAYTSYGDARGDVYLYSLLAGDLR
jgi:[ribosomal protein S5]-alanine N-acetyltransferase